VTAKEVTPEEVAEWWRSQGLPPRFSDAAHQRLAQVLRGIDQDDGAPDRSGRRRGNSMEPTAATRRAARQPRGSRGA
jgi:hypothetical protein